MTNGIPTNTRAMVSPIFVYAISIPRAASGFPRNPSSLYSLDSVIPATAVGRQNGSSMNPSSIFLPGKSYLTSVHAIIRPNTVLTIAAMNEQPMLVLNAFSTFFFRSRCQNSPGESFSDDTSTDASGIRTISDSIAMTIPSVR